MKREGPLPRLLGERWDDVLEKAVSDAAAADDTPMALVTLLTDRLQVFAAHVGLPPELEVSRATSREVAFCNAMVGSGAPLVVQDAVEHDGLRPELTDIFDLRAYLGVPVRVEGVVVGGLVALDHRARDFDDKAVARLQELATAVEQRLAARAAAAAAVDLEEAELLPYLWLLQAAQVGALSAEALTRALRVLPPVPARPPSRR
jgi:GAF domain-containing protein